MSEKKERVDILLVERGLCETREKAKRSIMAGIVYSDTIRIDKPGAKISVNAPLEVKGNISPYVGRGGFKLEKALREFQIDLQDKIVIDIGASTGGFTDCALQNGAKLVYALDVGYNQLAWKLRQDERVVVMERTNFRYATSDIFTKGIPEFATIDVSFISLKLILPVLYSILQSEGYAVVLVKPQFEAGREEVGKKGIVRDAATHVKVLTDIVHFSLAEKFKVLNASYSPITGGDGNIEFLLYIQKADETQAQHDINIEEIVKEAHQSLKTS